MWLPCMCLANAAPCRMTFGCVAAKVESGSTERGLPETKATCSEHGSNAPDEDLRKRYVDQDHFVVGDYSE